MSLTFALQALLARHEAYMAAAEEERRKMGASIDKLETEKKNLEAANAKTIDENRYLLVQLEELNNTVSGSDSHVLALNETLLSTRKELERLTVVAAQTSQLEAQLLALEGEQVGLQHQLISTKEDERSAITRWKGAERTIATLQEQVDRLDREAREERARHVDVVARFERRRAVERELEGAAKRLKGAAATSTLSRDGGNNVVSHFVNDILQDNANLQIGIVELQEMLMGSNEEVENLREQMMLHQPELPQSEDADSSSYLNSELIKTPTNQATPDLHVHHHYHAATRTEPTREKLAGVRRPKKRRVITSPGLRTPVSETQTPQIPSLPNISSVRAIPASSADTILSQTSVTIPPSIQTFQSPQRPRQSSRAATLGTRSSPPSSPQSAFTCMSFFDNTDEGLDSKPTTPGSTSFNSPDFHPQHFKRGSDISARSLSIQPPSLLAKSIIGVLQSSKKDDYNDTAFPLLDHGTIPEEPEDDFATRPSTNDTDQAFAAQEEADFRQQLRPRVLHRASSHESILSIRGPDLPKLRTKRSQLINGQSFSPRSSLGTSSASVGPVTSSTSAVAMPSKASRGYDSSNYNRLLLASVTPTSPTANPQPAISDRFTLGRRVGGWITGKWGATPTSVAAPPTRATSAGSASTEPTSTGDLRSHTALINAALTVPDTRTVEVKDKGRSGANKAADRLSTHVEAVKINESLLQESLGEG